MPNKVRNTQDTFATVPPIKNLIGDSLDIVHVIGDAIMFGSVPGGSYLLDKIVANDQEPMAVDFVTSDHWSTLQDSVEVGIDQHAIGSERNEIVFEILRFGSLLHSDLELASGDLCLGDPNKRVTVMKTQGTVGDDEDAVNLLKP